MDKRGALITEISETLARKDIKGAENLLATEWKFAPLLKPSKRKEISLSLQLEVFKRDHFTCRYCGKETIYVGALRLINHLLPEEFPYHKNWKWEKTHPAFWELSASCDHILSVARGGGSEMENLVTSCYMCNSIKAHWTIEELRWELKEINHTAWDGLTTFFKDYMVEEGIDDKVLLRYLKALKSTKDTLH